MASFGVSEEGRRRLENLPPLPWRRYVSTVTLKQWSRVKATATSASSPAPTTAASIGASLVGPHVTELVHELVLAAQAGLTLDDVAQTIHAHPTLAEAVGEAGPGPSAAACTRCEKNIKKKKKKKKKKGGGGKGGGQAALAARAAARPRPVSSHRRVCSTSSTCTPSAVEARCPNKGECFAAGTAAFLILGDACTRALRLLRRREVAGEGVAARTTTSRAGWPRRPRDSGSPPRGRDQRHPRRPGPTAAPSQYAATVAAIREVLPEAEVEVLVPDFRGRGVDLETVLAARPDVLNHNLETVPRLYAEVRPGASYRRSLELLRAAAQRKRAGAPALVKTGLMLGLGETADEVGAVLADCVAAGVDLVTVGQYLCPAAGCLPVVRYVTPDEFAALPPLRRESRPAGRGRTVRAFLVPGRRVLCRPVLNARRGG